MSARVRSATRPLLLLRPSAGPRVSSRCVTIAPLRPSVIPSLRASSDDCCASPRFYYSPAAPAPYPFSAVESAILSSARSHVAEHGFSHAALLHGARDAGYPPVSTAAFARGPMDLVLYHLACERLALKDAMQFPTPPSPATAAAHLQAAPPLSVSDKVRRLVLARLHANEPIVAKLPEALGLMSLAGNIPAALAELSHLVDEIWFLAGDTSVDSSWYTKRAMLAAVYSSSEFYMTQDKSPGFVETDAFVNRRLDDVSRVGATAGAVTEWIGFTGLASVNVVRSWGVRI